MKELTWKAKVEEAMPEELAHQIDIFEGQMELMQRGKLDEKVFAETRLRQGVYGQRYDNGRRHDGRQDRQIAFPAATKGPGTAWDAPGMQRIKIPFGRLTPDQLEELADLADEYSDGILHVTTRQDIQLHYVHIEDTPDMMRRLAGVGITTKEACGNVTRNVTGCHLAGVCRSEKFDISPYAQSLTEFLLGHDDAQDFGRKLKVAFSGCEQEACGLVMMHDVGFVAKQQEIEGSVVNGFKMVVGGGLGAVPHQAKVLEEFVPANEILPITQAIARVFARLGEKKNRNRARIKFLVAKLGIEAFREMIYEERKQLPYDPRWDSITEEAAGYEEVPFKPSVALNGQTRPDGFDAWLKTNVYAQRQPGYVTVTLRLPLGDLTSNQAVQLADIVREFVGEHVRMTVEQNIVLRWVSESDLPNLYTALKSVGLGQAGAESIVDITSCPGTDTCKLGIAASRGLAGTLISQLDKKFETLPDIVKELRIKISGCFNSCGQHHVADIGFYGNSRKVGNYKVPHFQVVLGGTWKDNAASFGLAMGAVPSKLIPDTLEAITKAFVSGKAADETFQTWVTRLGKKEVREIIKPFMITPDFETQPGFFSDWGDPRVFTLNDLGIGECAGEVVSLFSIEISKAESEVFDAQIALDDGRYRRADARAYQAMLHAARALLRTKDPNVSTEPQEIVQRFKSEFYDTELFFDQFAKGKFARYLFTRHSKQSSREVFEPVLEVARQTIEEAQLFIEAAHACDMRLNSVSAAPVKTPLSKASLPPAGKLPPKLPPSAPGKRPNVASSKLPPALPPALSPNKKT
ncbi:MAG: nitrite/sulfite reductase [Rhodothermales bacterium]